MRIGIEAQRIFRPKKHGMDMVALELIKNLQEIDTLNEYFIFVQPDTDDKVLTPTANFQIIPLKKSPYPVWEQYHLRRAVKKYKLDMLHCTSNTAPVNLKVPLLITLHDIIYLEKMMLNEGTWYQRAGSLYRRWNVPIVAKFARYLFTVSRYEQERIIQHFGYDEDKVKVVYNGVRPHFRVMDKLLANQKRQDYGLPAEYMLFLGNTDPKKNLIGVMKALKMLHKQNESGIPALVMPDFGKEHLSELLAGINAEFLMEKIHLTGYVPNEDLPAIYNCATLFLYPSLRESFGLPILEAMACACPVISSNTSSMPEISGEGALLIDPFKPEELAEAIYKLLNDMNLCVRLIEAGKKRVPLFSYRKAAETVLEHYQMIHQQEA